MTWTRPNTKVWLLGLVLSAGVIAVLLGQTLSKYVILQQDLYEEEQRVIGVASDMRELDEQLRSHSIGQRLTNRRFDLTQLRKRRVVEESGVVVLLATPQQILSQSVQRSFTQYLELIETDRARKLATAQVWLISPDAEMCRRVYGNLPASIAVWLDSAGSIESQLGIDRCLPAIMILSCDRMCFYSYHLEYDNTVKDKVEFDVVKHILFSLSRPSKTPVPSSPRTGTVPSR